MKRSELIKNHSYIYRYKDEIFIGKYRIQKIESLWYTNTTQYTLQSFYRDDESKRRQKNLSIYEEDVKSIRILAHVGETCDINKIKRNFPEYFI